MTATVLFLAFAGSQGLVASASETDPSPPATLLSPCEGLAEVAPLVGATLDINDCEEADPCTTQDCLPDPCMALEMMADYLGFVIYSPRSATTGLEVPSDDDEQTGAEVCYVPPGTYSSASAALDACEFVRHLEPIFNVQSDLIDCDIDVTCDGLCEIPPPCEVVSAIALSSERIMFRGLDCLPCQDWNDCIDPCEDHESHARVDKCNPCGGDHEPGAEGDTAFRGPDCLRQICPNSGDLIARIIQCVSVIIFPPPKDKLALQGSVWVNRRPDDPANGPRLDA